MAPKATRTGRNEFAWERVDATDQLLARANKA